MDINAYGKFLIATAGLATIAYFLCLSALSAGRRLLASVHGWAALAILPVAGFFGPGMLELPAGVAVTATIAAGAVASTSLFYALAMTPKRFWYLHLLLVPVALTIAVSFVLAMFLLGGH